MRKDKVIEIKNVTVYRGRTMVFKNLSLEIERGCSTAIIGPNGAGKSTLLKLLTREIYPVQRDGSHVKVLGEQFWNVWDLRPHLGIISDDLQQQYLGSATGMNVLLSGLYSSIDIWRHQRFNGRDRQRANRIMEMLEVSHCRQRRFAEMSTGEQRRFLLGRALIHDPDVLVLDEPTTGLDVKACFQYLDIVRGLIRSGKTLVLVTHHIHEIPPEVSRVVMLREGKVMADGGKSEMLTSENLGRLFDISIDLAQISGFYQTMPGVS
jgi:iron complex transport system ATP-binding protein